MNKKNKMCKFIPFSRVLHKKLKKGKFREEFHEELHRLKLAHEIRALRQKKRLTQKQVALKAQMPQSVVARLESGEHGFSLTTLDRIAKIFRKEVGLVEQTSNRR